MVKPCSGYSPNLSVIPSSINGSMFCNPDSTTQSTNGIRPLNSPYIGHDCSKLQLSSSHLPQIVQLGTWSLWPLVWLVMRSPESPSIFPSCWTVSYLSDLSGLVKPLRALQDILFPWHVSLHWKFCLVRGKIAGVFLSMKIIKNQVLFWSAVIQIACSSLFSCKY